MSTLLIDPSAGNPSAILFNASGETVNLETETSVETMQPEVEVETQTQPPVQRLASFPEPDLNEQLRQALEQLALLRQPASPGQKPAETLEQSQGWSFIVGTAGTTTQPSLAKNHVAGKLSNKKYILLTKTLASWGKVPRQQADLAAILAGNMEVGKEYSEEQVWQILDSNYRQYPSLANSKQHVTYLCRYYRGLKNDHKTHAGFVARGFLRVN